MVESTSYEFSDSQNGLVRDLAQKMQFVSYVLIALGAIVAIGGLLAVAQGGLGGLIQGIIQIVVGVWTNRAASAFRQIAETQGRDIENLMGALGELRKLYTLQFWALIIGLIFSIVGIILLMVSGAGVPR